MPDKPVPRLVVRQKRPAPPAEQQTRRQVPRITINQQGQRQGTQRVTTNTSSQSAVSAAVITLGQNIDSNSPITVNTEQLCSGTYVLGVQGVGKSSLLEQVACQLLELDESLIVFDPHGQLIDNIIKRMPARRLRDTFHLDLKDRQYPFALNVFTCADPEDEEERDRTRNQVAHAFEKLWPQTQRGVYFKKVLRHVIILLIENPGLTLTDVPKLLRDGEYRDRYVKRLKNVGSQQFWEYDYGSLSPARQREEAAPLLSRIDEMLAEPVLERILCHPRSTVNLRSIIDRRQNLFVTLPINEEAYAKASEFVGTMLMSLVYAATFSFADVPEEKRPGFSLIVDEFQNFATEDYAKLFAQGRKFKVKQFLAHQYRGQLSDSGDANRDATLSAFTKIVFRVTEPDSRALGSLFLDVEGRRQPVNLAIDILDKLEKHPNPVVKEFAARFVWPLQAGAKDKMDSEPRYIARLSPHDEYKRLPANLDYDTWRWYMLNHYGGYISPNAQPARLQRELHERVMNPRQGRDYELVPVCPRRNFGVGMASFTPEGAKKALEMLNEVLYEAQKTGVDNGHDPKTELNEKGYRKLAILNRWISPMLLFNQWSRVWDDTDEQQRLQLVQDTIEGKRPDLTESYNYMVHWYKELDKVLVALIVEPITQGGSEVRPSDVAQSLQHLPLRQAFVRIGTDGQVMETLPLSRGVEEDEEQRRRSLIRRQTRETLCRHIKSVVRDETPADEPVPSYEPEEVYEEPVAATAPVIRRSRPLP
jgi:hypothetical protein